jgi:hypothetical protein
MPSTTGMAEPGSMASTMFATKSGQATTGAGFVGSAARVKGAPGTPPSIRIAYCSPGTGWSGTRMIVPWLLLLPVFRAMELEGAAGEFATVRAMPPGTRVWGIEGPSTAWRRTEVW